MSRLERIAMIRKLSPAVLLLSFVCIQLRAQPRVDARNTYERLMAVVPVMIGAGSADDPKRPMYAPTPAQVQTSMTTRQGILAFTHVMSDDGTLALVEYVARDRSAFQAILADPTVKSFLKGRDKREDMEAEFLLHKANFNFAMFGVRMP
jgi:hypothetical protein